MSSMKKSMIVLRQEVWSLISRFSFWFGALGVPVIAFLIYGGVAWINQSQGGDELGGSVAGSPFKSVGEMFSAPVETRPQGYVDLAGLVQSYPPGFSRANWIAYPDEAKARAALDQGKISAFYVIAADYVSSGKMLAYVEEFNIIASQERASGLTQLINFNLLKSDPALADAVRQPLQNIQEVSLAPKDTPRRDTQSGAAFFLPYSVMMLFFFAVMGSATMLLNSVAKEKETRMMEILMVSSSAHEMLLGKILGLGIVGLLQVVVWGGSGLALLRLSGQTFNLPAELIPNPTFLVWMVVYFVLGYLVYAALMAGVGALVPSLREASQATFVITMPLMIPLFLLTALIQKPDGVLAVVLSLFPFTAPTTMMMRLSVVSVPLWQLVVSLLLLVATALLVIRMVAGMFRAQTILSGQAFNIKRLFLALAGKG